MAKRGPTPMMEQYLGIKAQHPDKIVLFRMGDFYETFYDDAEDVAGLLGITLTAREKKGDRPIPLAGVPFHALEHYLPKLLAAGRTVAICEQMEDPAQAKGLVRRDVVEILSPGTVTNPALLEREREQVRQEAGRWARLFAGGEIDVGELTLDDPTLRDRVLDVLGNCLAAPERVGVASDGSRVRLEAPASNEPDGELVAPDGVFVTPRYRLRRVGEGKAP